MDEPPRRLERDSRSATTPALDLAIHVLWLAEQKLEIQTPSEVGANVRGELLMLQAAIAGLLGGFSLTPIERRGLVVRAIALANVIHGRGSSSA